MKALTLWQPWASLVAVGAKTIETRSWSTQHRGPLAIHAGARRMTVEREAVWRCSIDDPSLPTVEELPHGAIVATCQLIAVLPMIHVGVEHLCCLNIDGSLHEIDADQLPLGDFSPRRFAWLLDDVNLLDEPIPARGAQTLWETSAL